MDAAAVRALEPFVRQKTVLLATFRRDGAPVGTPVNIAVDGGRAYVRTFDRSWKLKRIRNDPAVEVRPSNVRGRPTGPALRARARLLDGAEAAEASRAIAAKHPLLHGVLVPLFHRLRGYKTAHLEITPAG